MLSRFRLGIGCLIATAAFGLAACGDDEESGETAASPTPAATQAAETPTATQEAPEAAPAAGGKTKPGTELAVGETAHVDINPLSATDEKDLYPLDATVVAIEKGSIDDFKNIKLDAKQKESTPYYVKVKIAATGKTFDVKDGDPDIRFDGIDDRGQEQGSVTFFGDFERCDDKEAPDPFTKGKSYESCLTYLVPGGGSIEAVHWTGSEKYVLDPVVWK